MISFQQQLSVLKTLFMCFIQDISLTRALFPQRLNKCSLHGNCAQRYDILYASHVGDSESASIILRSTLLSNPHFLYDLKNLWKIIYCTRNPSSLQSIRHSFV